MTKTQMRNATDQQLATDWQAGNALACEVLLARSWPRLERYFTGKISDKDGRAVIPDLVQETLRRVSKSIRGYEHRGAFRAYVNRIAYFVFCDWLELKLQGRDPIAMSRDAEDHLERVVSRDAVPGQLEAQRREALPKALRGLQEVDRAIIELHFYDGLSYDEIIDRLQLGCTNQALRNRVHRIKRTLRKAIDVLGKRTLTGPGERGMSLEQLLVELGRSACPDRVSIRVRVRR